MKELKFKVLGRTLEHFGVQMYKRREIAIAELVANAWDAGATQVILEIPSESDYRQDSSTIVITDNGIGMGFDDVQHKYLVLGRNRRHSDGLEYKPLDNSMRSRPLMGRKGIGKLAGFGLAKRILIYSWNFVEGICFTLDLDMLKLNDNESRDVPIPWETAPRKTELSPSGTVVTLEVLKHKTPIDTGNLAISLSRRFSRIVRGEMTILLNDDLLPDPTPELDARFPNASGTQEYNEEQIAYGQKVKYWYGFAKRPIPNRELRGFTVLAHGRVAQAPPYFFEVEATASGQHSTKYVIGEIEADFIEDSISDEEDLVSTDRQEIDWESSKAELLKNWGERLARKALAECRDFRGGLTKKRVLADPEFAARVEKLDRHSQQQVERLLKLIGLQEDAEERERELADLLVRAYEFQHFHDHLAEIEQIEDDPNQLSVLLTTIGDWNVLESRAILEVIKGRLEIVDKFEKMLCNDAPETTSARSPDNMHDLIAGSPWILNPEWQVLAEEKRITTQLREWCAAEVPDFTGRYDFLALGDDARLVVIEIKRPDYAAEIAEIHRLTNYVDKLSLAHGNKDIFMVLICGRDPRIRQQELEAFQSRKDAEIRYWNEVFAKTVKIYGHYRALLEAQIDHPDFRKAIDEVVRIKNIRASGTVRRSSEDRAKGVPESDD